jgi:hypothetical protein
VSDGINVVVSTNRDTSVRSWLLVDARTARRAHLRSRATDSNEPFIIGTSRTRARTGTRTVNVPISARSQFALRRYHRRIAVILLSRVTDRSGTVAITWRRIALPSTVA